MNRKIILIAGSGRSGTTWVQDCIAESNDLRTIFEPLHPVGVPRADKFSFMYRESVADDPELKMFMDQVLSGDYRSMWMNYRIRPDRFNIFRTGIPNAVFNARKFVENYKKYHGKRKHGIVVKFIRANLMLPWIVEQYDVKALLVTRHPCAVIASRLKLGGIDWTSQLGLDRYRADQEVTQLILEQFNIDINEPFSLVGALACVWCIENLLPIKWAADAGYMVAAYEKLLLEPGREWDRVIHGLDLSHVPDDAAFQSPSQQVSPEMRGKAFSGSHLGKWRETLSAEQTSDISSILDRFSCSVYTVDDDLPIKL